MAINFARGIQRLIIIAILGGLAGVLILWLGRIPITIEYMGLSVLASLPVMLVLFYGWVIQGFRK